MLKRFLLAIVLKTSYFPFTIFYKFCYDLSLKIIVNTLARQNPVTAIYLTAGLATGNYTYGLSDIDLIIIVKKNEDKQEIEKVYRRLSRLFPFLKYAERSLSTSEQVSEGYAADIFFKYKFDDCRKRGRLLYGKDILRSLPELDEEGKKKALIGRLAFIWATLVKHLFLNKQRDPVIQNYLCYKLSADSRATLILAKGGPLAADRSKVWGLSSSGAEEAYSPHISRMRELPKAKFSSRYPLILQDTYAFCFDMLSGAARYIESGQVKIKQRESNTPVYFETGSADFILSDSNKEAINKLVDLLNKRYTDYVESILISSSVLVGTDEEGVCLFITQNKKIPFEIAEEISSTLISHASAQRIYLYILTADSMFSLNRSDFTQSCSSFSPYSITPLQFLFLKDQASVLSGVPLKCMVSPDILTSIFLQSFSESYQWDENRILKLINDKDVLRLPNIKFHLLFWQALQLILIKNSAIPGRIPVPLSSAQVCRYWNISQEHKLNWLEEFYSEYKKDLNGTHSDSEVYFTKAVAALKSIYNPSSL